MVKMAKVLYVDETGNNEFFIVAGLLVNDEELELCYRQFKHDIRNYRLSSKDRQRIYTEFKSTLLDRHFQKIKAKMLKSIENIDHKIFWCKWIINRHFDQSLKEEAYLKLLLSIVENVDESDIVIVYDWFKNKMFEDLINRSILNNEDISDIKAGDSQKYHGLQYIDNICSAIRLKESGMNDIFYDIVADKMMMIDIFD